MSCWTESTARGWAGSPAACSASRSRAGQGRDQSISTRAASIRSRTTSAGAREMPEDMPQRPRASSRTGSVGSRLHWRRRHQLHRHRPRDHGGEWARGSRPPTWRVLAGNLPYHTRLHRRGQAYRNLVNELPLAEVPIYRNPYREWIGAQIRADFFGYCAPGGRRRPRSSPGATRLSPRQERHLRRDVCAAMISAALVTDDVNEIIRPGLTRFRQRAEWLRRSADCLKWRERVRDVGGGVREDA